MPQASLAQGNQGTIRLKRFMERDRLNLIDPTNIAYLGAERFLVPSATTVDGTLVTTLTTISPYEDRLASAVAPQGFDATVIAYDQQQQRLIFHNQNTNELEGAALLSNGLPDWSDRRSLVRLGESRMSTGMAVAADGTLFLLTTNSIDGTNILQQRSISSAPAATAATSEAGSVITDQPIQVDSSTPTILQGLTIHPQTGHLFTMDQATQRLLELTQNGRLVQSYDLTPFGLQVLQGLVIAPSADQTDDPAEQSLYVVDRLRETAAGSANGRVAEFTFTAAPTVADGTAEDVATLVQIVKTFEFSPPSPDPAGIAYIPANPYVNTSERILFSDSEVNEMALYDGANVFEMTFDGLLQKTYTTYPTITGEPAGLSFNPNNGHLFFTDDDNIRPLIEVSPGPDKEFLSADDTFTKFSLRDSDAYGNQDPEGVEYVRLNGIDTVFILDGLNSQLYVAQPGPDGIFNGIDDIVSDYDTESQGVEDPEGIAYHPGSGTLFLIGKPPTRVAELSITGELIRFVDISAANADKPAGLAFGPGSNNANELHLYIVDRGVDNDSDSKENDGLLYEFDIPTGSNRPPVVTVGPNVTVNWPDTVALTGAVTDDGLPEPATITTTWSKLSGPGDVSFADAAAIETIASFSLPGAYELQLTAEDGDLEGSAILGVTVEENNSPPIVEAGANRTIEQSETITLSATITDDGLPIDPGQVTLQWQVVSGPGDATFADDASASTTVNFDKVGEYLLRITANDGDLSSSDQLTITVLPNNQLPIVDAGPDQRIGLGDSTQLSGTAEDDGLPDPPAALTIRWSQISGRGTADFSASDLLSPTVSFTARGSYELALSVSDGKATVTDTLTVVVDIPNQPPTVDAGPDLRTTITETVLLQGSVSDDGIPSPPGAVTIEWRQLSGPGTVSFANRNVATTTASADVLGLYTLQLFADDGSLDASDSMTLNVGEPNEPPTFGPLGTSTEIITSATTISLSVTATDTWIPAPSGQLSYRWERVSGPSSMAIGTPTQNGTPVSFNSAGNYVIRVTASDGELESSLEFAVTITTPNFAPQVTLASELSVPGPRTIQLTATVTDDGQPDPPGGLTYQWRVVEGAESVTLGDARALTTSANFKAPGVYVITLTANDDELTGSATMTVTVGSAQVYQNYLPIIR